mmetsp:Transcript_3448/g.9148  ORF Transcript_3448/g.9148 Transcript_3448/m.9148 type:complete len:85 (-) Transcript_3448:366-620(-)
MSPNTAGDSRQRNGSSSNNDDNNNGNKTSSNRRRLTPTAAPLALTSRTTRTQRGDACSPFLVDMIVLSGCVDTERFRFLSLQVA